MIRKASPSDAKQISRVHISSWQEAYRHLIPTEYLNSLEATLAQRESFWSRSIRTGESTVLVVELNRQVVGWISVGANRDKDVVGENAGEVMVIYILAGYWHAGIGQALWKAGLQCLIEQGYQRLTLWALTRNERAARFYRRAGCVEEAGRERNLKIGGVTLIEIRYKLCLLGLARQVRLSDTQVIYPHDFSRHRGRLDPKS